MLVTLLFAAPWRPPAPHFSQIFGITISTPRRVYYNEVKRADGSRSIAAPLFFSMKSRKLGRGPGA